jgi:hypothetical protein
VPVSLSRLTDSTLLPETAEKVTLSASNTPAATVPIVLFVSAEDSAPTRPR